MYASKNGKWLKHLDFLLMDNFMLELAYYLSDILRNGFDHLFKSQEYTSVAVVLVLASVCVSFFLESYSGILRRSKWEELRAVLKQVIVTFFILVAFIFMTGYGPTFSRAAILYAALISAPFLWIMRTLRKSSILHKNTSIKRNMVVVTSFGRAESVVKKVCRYSYGDYQVMGIVLTDADRTGRLIAGCRVVCGIDNVFDYIQEKWIDDIYVDNPNQCFVPKDFLKNCMEMGITIHISLAGVTSSSQNMIIENIGGNAVLTKSVKITNFKQLVMKRFIDIIGSIVGLAITAVLTVIVGPLIFLASPGPIFFSQERIGKNGKPFKMYKFRSMVPNAEEMKKELVGKNKMNGQMFKMDADPRIIGSGPDGTRHGIGWFIRKTSIDEFPQFLNVFLGDMSLVGTRPPLPEE